MTRVVLALLLCACTERVQLDPHLGGLVALDVAPAQQSLSVAQLGPPAQTATFTATGHFADGSSRDVTAYVRWSVDDPAPGDFAAPGRYTTTNTAGGHVLVTADSGTGVTATARLDVIVSATLIDSTFPPPGDPATLFPPGASAISGDAMHGPAVVYPAASTRFPQGVARTLFQYTPGMQNDAFRLAFDSDVLHLVVYTGAARWAADGAAWQAIAGSGISGPITLVVTGTSSASPGTLYSSAPVPLELSPDAPAGPILYWSAATSGIMRCDLGSTTANKLYPPDGTCVGCHTATRDGSQLALGYGGQTLQTVSGTTLQPIIPASARIPMGWATFSPDGRRVLVANKGVLALFDAASGAPIGPPDGHVALPPRTFATHPDWSPDGSYVAVALTMAAPTNMDMNVANASIARLPFHDDKFGPPEVLVAATGMDNDYFPRYSPDGTYLAYVHAVGPSQGADSAELRLVVPGRAPIVLDAASHQLGGGTLANAADTMPTWLPTSGDRAWLAFTSARPYGAVLPMAGRAQIWVAAVVPGGGEEGDPSSPAFWLPCQDVTATNNNPIWIEPNPTGTAP